MGKKQQQQRTKGNVRPSSSSQAAQLLASSGSGVPGFVGFGAMSDLGYVPATQGADDTDSSVDSDFRMVLRKLSKRDSTTKLKALQELKDLCQQKSEEEVKTVLPFWPRIYSKVAIDNDRRVREACQQTFESLVQRVKRNLAPQLKAIIGPWLVSQCDVYGPAASAAKAAFMTAFPPAKQSEALVYCREEILAHIRDNLFNQTPSSLSDPKTTEPEDMESKYQKVITSTLGAVKVFLTTLPKSQHDKLEDAYLKLFGDSKFFKFGKHQVNMIRGAFYSAVSGICQGIPDVANQLSDKLCPVILHHLDDTDPVIVYNLWEATLFVISTVQDCWQKVNIRKGVLPKLWLLLRCGGGGSATVIYPNLLPFISKLPKETTRAIEFYQEFFNNAKIGLTEEKVLVSPSECSAIVSCFMECLRYALVQSLGSTETDPALQDYLLKDQLLPLLEASFLDKSASLSTSPLYERTADLMIYLEKQQATVEDESKKRDVEKVLNTTWEMIADMITQYVDDDHPQDYTVNRISKFLIAFKNPSLTSELKKETSRVKFSEETEKKGNLLPKRAVHISEIPILSNNGPFQAILSTVCAKCLNRAKQGLNFAHVNLVSAMLDHYLVPEIVMSLLDSMEFQQHEQLNEKCEIFCDKFFFPWIKEICERLDGHQFKVLPSLVSIFLSLLVPVSNEYKTQLLDSLSQQCGHPLVIYSLSEQIIQDRDPSCMKWMQQETYSDILIKLMTELGQESLKPESDRKQGSQMKTLWQLFTLVLSHEGLVTCDTIDKIVGGIRHTLPTRQKSLSLEEGDRCVNFVCDISQKLFSSLKSCFSLVSSEELLLALFQLSGYSNVALSESVLLKVSDTWKIGVELLTRHKGGHLIEEGFLVRACTYIKYQVLNDCQTVSRVQELTQLTLSLLVSAIKGVSSSDCITCCLNHPLISALIQQLHIPALPVQHKQWSRGLIVANQLACSVDKSDFSSVHLDYSVPKSVIPVAFTGGLVNLILEHINKQGSALDTEEAGGENEPVFSADTIKETVIELMKNAAMCDSILYNVKKAHTSTELFKVTELLTDQYQNLLKTLDDNSTIQILQTVLTRSFEEGMLSAITLKVLLSELNRIHSGFEMKKIAESVESISPMTVSAVQTVEVVLPYLNRTELIQLMEINAAQIITSPDENIPHIEGAIGSLSVISKALFLLDTLINPDSATLNHEVPIGVLRQIQSWRDELELLFAFDRSLNELSWEVGLFNTQVVDLFTALVTKLPSRLDDGHWDFVLCSLASWIQTIHGAAAHLADDLTVQALVTACMRLLSAVTRCVKTVMPEHPGDFPANITTEWDEFFSEGIFSVLLPLYINYAEACMSASLDIGQVVVLRSFSEAIILCPVQLLQDHKLQARLVADEQSNLPDSIQTLLNHLCPLLLHTNRAVQLAAYKLLLLLMPELPAYDQKENKDEDQEKGRSPPFALMTVLERGSAGIELITTGLSAEDHVTVPAYTEEHTYAMGYLLTWKIILTFFRAASSELRVEYAKYLRDLEHVDTLLMNLLYLMPETPVVQLTDSLTSQPPSQKLANTKNLFAEDPLLDISDCDDNELQHVACTVYKRTLQDLPAMVRQWWNSQDKKVASIVDKFTSKYVSPLLCMQEIQSVQTSQVKLNQMTVKTRPAAREVVALYSVDEVSMELVVCLPLNHPLGLMTVECGKRVGVANTQWRNWMLQLTTFLAHQNGSIIDGLSLWKHNIDKRFEGVEDCNICFSVIHGSNCQLPKLACKTCKKKFHSACLYKWFSTSHNSTCPMCRNLF